MTRRIAAALSAVTLSALVAPVAMAQAAPDGFWRGEAEREAAIRHEVAAQLREPESAYFRDVVVKRSPSNANGPHVVCGMVQGRNGYGGMSQPQPFFYTDKATLMADAGPGAPREVAGVNRTLWAQFCGDAGPLETVRALEWND